MMRKPVLALAAVMLYCVAAIPATKSSDIDLPAWLSLHRGQMAFLGGSAERTVQVCSTESAINKNYGKRFAPGCTLRRAGAMVRVLDWKYGNLGTPRGPAVFPFVRVWSSVGWSGYVSIVDLLPLVPSGTEVLVVHGYCQKAARANYPSGTVLRQVRPSGRPNIEVNVHGHHRRYYASELRLVDCNPVELLQTRDDP